MPYFYKQVTFVRNQATFTQLVIRNNGELISLRYIRYSNQMSQQDCKWIWSGVRYNAVLAKCLFTSNLQLVRNVAIIKWTAIKLPDLPADSSSPMANCGQLRLRQMSTKPHKIHIYFLKRNKVFGFVIVRMPLEAFVLL